MRTGLREVATADSCSNRGQVPTRTTVGGDAVRAGVGVGVGVGVGMIVEAAAADKVIGRPQRSSRPWTWLCRTLVG